MPFLQGSDGRSKRWFLTIVILVLIALSLSLAMTQSVVLKMLPFDNKSEFQVVVDMPEGNSLEDTAAVMRELSQVIASVPEVRDYQAYVGTASPINFNGLVRQYYLREGAFVGDIQVNLIDKSQRSRKSHEIAQSIREPLQQVGKLKGANVKVVEVPPGPPVMSPLVAEIYGLDYAGQVAVAKSVRKVFEETPNIVDVDDSVEAGTEKLVVKVDRQKAALAGVSQQAISELLYAALHGEDVGYMHGEHVKYPVPIRLELPDASKASTQSLLDLTVTGQDGSLIALSELVEIVSSEREVSIYHKDLMPVVFVTADMAGELDSPLYGMFDIYSQLQEKPVGDGVLLTQNLLNPPATPYQYGMKWDGEWQITYDTFRDMGIAYSIGLLMIYLLVVAQFGSYLVPLVIMSPIPLTIIGVMPGHAILDAQFTATSMIGMIALAGIIVRNSILLVDFINAEVRAGVPFQAAVIQSGAVRAKPIILTGLAAMLGALFILDDPIFSGLAISLIFGILVSTLLTLLVIPVMYYALMRQRLES
jgi:multidrug efflux pump subunit AcrB